MSDYRSRFTRKVKKFLKDGYFNGGGFDGVVLRALHLMEEVAKESVLATDAQRTVERGIDKALPSYQDKERVLTAPPPDARGGGK